MKRNKGKKVTGNLIYLILPILIVIIITVIFVYILNKDPKIPVHSEDDTEQSQEPSEIDWTGQVAENTDLPSSENNTEPVDANTSEDSSSEKESAGSSSETSEASSTTPESSEPTSEVSQMSAERVVYKEGFYYEPISEAVKERINGKSYKEDCIIPYEDLRYMSVLYNDFSGNTATGEIICNKAIAQDFIEIFYDLYTAGYQIEKIRLVDEYDADDRASMGDNNTSAFNYRIVSGTTHLSQHAYGTAIDVNPFYNPYCEPDGYVSPPGSEIYADRTQDFPHKIDENDLCYQLFIAHGFTWGGAWASSRDYQHFQKKLN